MLQRGKLRFGIAIPQVFPQGNIDPELIAGFLRRAEDLGFDSAWVTESTASSTPQVDAVPLLSFAAAHTRRVRLGTSVMVTTIHSPMLLAKELASADQLSQGRIILGAGVGSVEGLAAYGIPSGSMGDRFEEGIQLMRRLWAEEKVTFNGQFWQLENQGISSRPFQKPHVPVWMGSLSPRALRRTARLADGWMGAGYAPVEHFKKQIRLLRRYLEEQGRDPATFPLSKRVYIAVDSDRKRAAAGMEKFFSGIYGSDVMARSTGVPREALDAGAPVSAGVERLSQIIAEGIDLLMLHPVYDPPHHMDQLERLARDVIPKLPSM